MKTLKHFLLSLLIAAICTFTFAACNNTEKFSVTGQVENIERGKDGYTAVIATKEGKQYDAVISRVNMANTTEYQELKIGDVVTVAGDTIHLGDRVSITAESIRR